ncbi:MAG: hydroxymethylbilane synthase, partial [Candidatus Eremiobacteraeota bacterium]|nr:hydroxymethylbilane synthase [Candidatus Eremiobacteraeota bacterium]
RLRKVAEGHYDAIVLAMAGLRRLGAGATHVVPFEIEQVVPAVGQGALAVETRADDEWLIGLLRAAVNDPESELCVTCERAALRAMRAGCSAPLGVHARFAAGTMIVEGCYVPEHGARLRARVERRVASLLEAEELGAELASRLTT